MTGISSLERGARTLALRGQRTIEQRRDFVLYIMLLHAVHFVLLACRVVRCHVTLFSGGSNMLWSIRSTPNKDWKY